jgi:hypothetical protein
VAVALESELRTTNPGFKPPIQGARVVRRTREFDTYLGGLFGSRSTGDGAKTKKRTRHREKHPSEPTLPGRTVEQYRSVRVSKIVDPNSIRELDDDLVNSIAESAQVVGLIQPIAVRKVKVERDGKVSTKIVVVAGAHRLQAARILGHRRIDCRFIENDDVSFVQLVQIGEQLFRKHLSVLSQSELLTKWCELVFADRVSGQDGQKRKRGRPRGGESEAARYLPVGRSEHARRHLIRRAKKISGITPEAKEATIDGGLADNQNALLAIANISGRKAQLRKVASLVNDAGESGVDVDTEGKGNSEQPKKRREEKTDAGRPDTTFAQLEEVWDKHCRRLWKYLPQLERERFIGVLRRALCKAHRNVLAFVRDVFTGREQVAPSDLYALAKKRGLPKKEVRFVVKSQGHRLKRIGRYRHSKAYYLNYNKNWEQDLPKISEGELTGRKRQKIDDCYPGSEPQPRKEADSPSPYVLDTQESKPSEEEATSDPFRLF